MTPGGSFDVEGKTVELEELKKAASEPGLWNDQDRARRVTRKLARYEATINQVAGLAGAIEDAEVLLDLATEEDDAGASAEVDAELIGIEAELSKLEPGQVLQVVARDSAAPQDLPAWCELTGHTMLRCEHPNYWIQRRTD